MLSGDNSILQRATDAKTKSDEAQIRERIQLAYHSALTKDITGENGKLTMPTLQTELNNEFVGKTVTITPSADNKEWTIKVDDVEVTVTAGKGIPQVATLPRGKGTIPYFPSDSFSQVDGTDLSTGLVITDEVDKDGNSVGNEYVWIEVPSTYVDSTTTNGPDYSLVSQLTDYTNIKAALLEYTETLLTPTGTNSNTTKLGWSDEWYDSTGKNVSQSTNVSDTTGCGLTNNQYTELYQKMLKSIYENGGFWIGRYEAGIEGSDVDTTLARQAQAGVHLGITSSSPKAVSKPDHIPYNILSCSEAQSLANSIEHGSYNSSLMFGLQWDLVLKYLANKATWTSGQTSDYYLKTNSESWGNYDLEYELNQAKSHGYKGDFVPFYGDTTVSWSTIDSGYSHPKMFYQGVMNDSVIGYTILSTGASSRNMKQNIYDLAGNMYEWTLEHATSETSKPCVARGGNFNHSGSANSVSYRVHSDTSGSPDLCGFRVCIY